MRRRRAAFSSSRSPTRDSRLATLSFLRLREAAAERRLRTLRSTRPWSAADGRGLRDGEDEEEEEEEGEVMVVVMEVCAEDVEEEFARRCGSDDGEATPEEA